jgi:hypothetical protein
MRAFERLQRGQKYEPTFVDDKVKDLGLKRDVKRLRATFKRESADVEKAGAKLQALMEGPKTGAPYSKGLITRQQAVYDKELAEARTAMQRITSWQEKHPRR